MFTGGRGPVVKVATSMSYRDQDGPRILLGKRQTKSFAVILSRNPNVSRHAEHTVAMQPVLLQYSRGKGRFLNFSLLTVGNM
jgi:hypothetical protein